MQADIALFGQSQVRRQIFERFFSRPGVVRHVRELAREFDRLPTIVGAELDRRERTGVLTCSRIGAPAKDAAVSALVARIPRLAHRPRSPA